MERTRLRRWVMMMMMMMMMMMIIIIIIIIMSQYKTLECCPHYE